MEARKRFEKPVDCRACGTTADKCAGHMGLREAVYEPERVVTEAGITDMPPRALKATDRRIDPGRGFELGGKSIEHNNRYRR